MNDEVRPFDATGTKETALILNLDGSYVQYEWIADEQRWVKFFDADPEPPAGLPPGKFDGQIIDYKAD